MNYSRKGIKSFSVLDLALVDDQWGPHADRSREHLVRTAESMIRLRLRQRMLQAARQLQEVQERLGLNNPEASVPAPSAPHSPATFQTQNS